MINTLSTTLSEQGHKASYSLNLLDSFLTLQNDWNGNGATGFELKFIEKVKTIVSELEVLPKIYPTGRGSIQLEYEKKNGDYLEFEIFSNHTINCFVIMDEKETEEGIDENQMNKYLSKFYATTGGI